jgi:hypothetical protein
MSLSLKRSHVGRNRRSGQYSRRAIWAAIEPLEPRQLLSVTVEQSVNTPITSGTGTDRPFPTAHDEGYLVDLNSTYTANGTPIYDIVFLGQQGVTVMMGNGDGTFRPPTIYPVGPIVNPTGPVYADMVLADVNGDGLLDAVVVESAATRTNGALGPPSGSQGTVSVLLANANGTFKPEKHYYTGSTPDALAVGYLSNDEPDIAIANRKTRSVSLLLGNGDGTFKIGATIPGAPPYASTIAIGDVNGDGIGDIVVGGYNPKNPAATGYISVFVGQGGANPTFGRLKVNVPEGYDSRILSVGTYEGAATQYDGDGEIIARGDTFINTNPGSPIPTFAETLNDYDEVLEKVNNYSGGLTLASFGTYYGYSAVSIDISGTVQTYSTIGPDVTGLNAGNIGYGTDAIAVPIAEPNQTAVINGDLNGATTQTGYPKIDVVTLNYGWPKYGTVPGPSISVLFGDGYGRFEAQKIDQVEPLGSGDLTTKPPTPIPGTENKITYPEKTAKQLFEYTNSYPNDFVTTDVNGDGDPTIQAVITATYGIGPTPGKPAVVTENGNSGNYYVTTEPVAPKPSEYPGTITVMVNTGKGSFYTTQNIVDPYGPVGVAVGDVTGDGIPDLVVINKYANFYGNSEETGNLWIFPGTGDGTFSPTPIKTYYAGYHPRSVGLVNLNGDGYSIVVAAAGHYYQPNTKIYGHYKFTSPTGEAVSNTQSYTPLNIHKKVTGGKTNPVHEYYGSVRALVNSGDGVFNGVNIPLADSTLQSGTKEFAAPLLAGANDFVQKSGYQFGESALVVGDFVTGNGALPNSSFAVAYKAVYYDSNTHYLYRDYAGSVILLAGDDSGAVNDISTSSVAPGPTQLVSGYFNGVGNPLDIAALSQTYEAISILTGAGNGTFSPSQTIQLDNNNFLPNNPNENEYDPIAIATGQVTGDGYDDLAVAYAGTDTKPGYKVSLFINEYTLSGGVTTGFNYAPTYTFHDTHQTLLDEIDHNGNDAFKDINTVPFGIALTDVQGDGLGQTADILTANNNLNYYASVSVLLTAQPPKITSNNSFTFTLGAYASDTLSSTGAPDPFMTETGLLPAGVSFLAYSNGTVNLEGTPAFGSQGEYVIQVEANNGIQPTATQTFTIFVDETPVFTGTNGFGLAAGIPAQISIPTAAYPQDTLTEAAGTGNFNSNGGLPAGLHFVDEGNGTAEIVGTPGLNSIGTYSLVVTATSTLAPNGVTFPITLYVSNPVAPTFTSVNTTTFVTGNPGSFAVTVSGTPTPNIALAQGRLPLGLTITSNANGTLIFSGTPAAGTGTTYPLIFTANNGVPNNTVTVSDSFTLTVDQAPGISSADTGTFTVGNTVSFPVTTTGFPTPTVTVTQGLLPPGLSLISLPNGTASVSGIPTAPGAYTVTLAATNTIFLSGTNTVESGSQIVVFDVDQAPSFAPGTSNNSIGGTVTFIAGVTNSSPGQQYNITAIGFPAPVINEIGFLPPGVSFSEVSSGTVTIATFSNTPLAGSGGNYDLLITATNSLGTATIAGNTSKSFDFVLTIGQPASINPGATGSATFTVGSFSSYPIVAVGYPAPTLTESGTLPNGITFNSGGTLSGTPTQAGIFDITLTATNGILTPGTQAFVLTVDGSPSFTPTNVTTTFGIGISNTYTVIAGGFPTPTLSATLGAGFDGLTFIDNGNGTGTLEGTPTDAVGTYQLVITATSALGSAPTPETLTLDLVNPGTAVFVGSASDSVPVLANDTVVIQTTGLPTASLSVLPLSLPSWASFTDEGNGTGEITGTPPLSAGNTVNDIYVYASNSFGVTTEEFVLTVTAQAPSFTGATAATVTVGTSASFSATATGFPTPALSVVGGENALPGGLTFTDNGNGTGSFVGTPTGSGGVYDITLQASNGIGQPITEIFAIDVDQAPNFTSASSATFVVGTGGTFTFVTSGFPTASLQVVNGSGSLPSGITFADDGNGDATLEGTPTPGEGGTYTFSVQATNGVGSGVTEPFTLVIDQVPTITSANTSSVATGSAENFTVNVSAFPDAAISETGLPAGLHLSLVDNGNDTATLAGTPPAGTEGSYTFTISAGNSEGTATQSFTLDVTQAPGIGTGNLGSGTAGAVFTVGTTQTAIINTTGFPTPTLSFTGTLPNGLTFESLGGGSAEITGTPTGPGGADTLTLTATSGGTHTSEPYVLVVDEAPVFTSANSTSNFAVDLPGVTYNVTTTSFPTDSFNSPVGLPAGLSLVDNSNGTATLEGTPTGPAGTYHVAIVATNSIGSTTQGFTVVVGNAPIVTLVSGVLTVTGTPGADNASVMVSGSNVIVDIDQLQNVNFPLSNITSVLINEMGGADSLTIGADVPPTSVMGGAGADTIIATNSAPDTIIGGAGSSSISATGSGNNLLISADAADTGTTIQAGSGNSTLFSGSGSDSLVGGSGNDFLRAMGPGSSTLMGGSGDATLKALSGNDSLVGGSGAMVKIKGGNGNDTLTAGSGNTTVRSVSGHDSIVANSGGTALIRAANHQDTIVGAIGSSGMDTIFYDSGDSIASATLDSPLDTMILVND